MMLLFWGLVIAGIVFLVRTLTGKGNAQEILERRYAAGEITKEQFEEMKRILG